ncbi:MAG: sigma-54-dependent transcriptional regulator [Gemmatimonadales bacterium]
MGGPGARRRRVVQDLLRGGPLKRVLVIDDEPGLRQSLGLLLSDAGYAVTAEGDGRRALERATQEPFDLVLCDVRMPEMDGLTFLRNYRTRGGTGLVIMMSAYGGEDAAIAAMKEGAYDYLPKPFRPDEVVLTLRKAEERERLRREVAGLRAQLATGPAERGMVAQSRAMRAALDLVARVAEHDTTVLITGESGTGKELIARAIHRASPRAGRGGAFVGINCAAIPDNLLESELFGHVRGAFTGATADKAGLFEQADGGTMLLDEIGELPGPLQAKRLRVLQDGEIRRVGDQKTRRVDVRVLAATARDLAAEAAAGRFREDLFYRLNVVAIALPPLRQRSDDIAPLARHFVARLAQRFARPLALSDGAVAWLETQEWRGNVRELENTIERAVVLSNTEVLEPADLASDRLPPPASRTATGDGQTLREVVGDAERRAIADALRAAAGNRREAAAQLGVSLRTLFYKMSRYGLD